MENIREWALTVCAVSVAVAALEMLMPKDRCGRLLRVCTAAVMISAVFAPLRNIDSCKPDELFSLHNAVSARNEELEETMRLQAERLAEKTLGASLLRAADELLPGGGSVAVDAVTDERGCIEISFVTVTIPPGGSVDENILIERMSQCVGIKRELITIEYE